MYDFVYRNSVIEVCLKVTENFGKKYVINVNPCIVVFQK